MLEQIKEYLFKYNITNKEQLEKHIEGLVRNTTVDKELVFTLSLVLDDKELLSNLFSAKKQTTDIDNRLLFAEYIKRNAFPKEQEQEIDLIIDKLRFPQKNKLKNKK